MSGFKILPLLLLSSIYCNAGIEKYFKPLEGDKGNAQIRNIDYIYMINLDQRPEKFSSSTGQLSHYGVFPHRFSAIYGWGLSAEAFNAVGLKFQPGMWRGIGTVLYFPPDGKGTCYMVNLNDSCYGYSFFSGWMTPGAIGCTLSHLSVLQDAYDAGYSTIWVLEDDIHVLDNPHHLAEYLDELDSLVGKDGWDILYTDCDYLMGLDESRDLLEQLPMKWRPDMQGFDLKPLLEHTDVGAHFMKIGTRHRTHSMIIRRAGMKKILDFYKSRNMFMPYDHELAFIPDMKLYVLKPSVVSVKETVSDTKNAVFR